MLETLRMSAGIGLPSGVGAGEREGRVQSAIDEMGLRSAASTKVGDIFFKGTRRRS